MGVSLVGRSVELAAVLDRLERHGRCSVVGPGGVGKSTLARAVGAASGRPVIWVDAEPIESIAGLAATILAALDSDAFAGADALSSSAHALVDREVLLVLDGVEHLVGVTDAIERLPSGPDAAWLLVTTRRSPAPTPVWRLEPLSTEGHDGTSGPGGDAGRLLCELLDALGEPATAPERVAQLAQETGGLPLAIELLAHRLASGRSGFGSDAGRTSAAAVADLSALDPALAASVLRSINLVDDDATRCFNHLGLTATAISPVEMAGLAGCSEETARESLLQLRQVGLTMAVDDRFDVLPPIRDAALAYLQRTGSFEADLDRAVAWATGWLRHLDGPTDRLDLDTPLRLAWLATRRRRPGVLRLVTALSGPLHRRMRNAEILSLVEAAIAVPGAEPAEEAAMAMHAAQAAAGSTSSRDAQRWLGRATQAASSAGNPVLLRCRIESTRSILALDAGDLPGARTAADLVVRLAEGDGGAEVYAWVSRHDLALIALQAGDLDGCEALARACVDWGCRHDLEIAQLGAVELAWAALERGRWADAAAQARRLRAEILEQIGHPTEVSEETVTIELLAAPDAAVVGLGDPRDLAWWPRLMRRIAEASVCPLERWDDTLDTVADVVAIADALPLVYPGVGGRLLLGDTALAGGELRQAHQAYEGALHTSIQAGYRLRAADALEGLAALAMAVDDVHAARRATGLATAIRGQCGAHPWPRRSLPDRSALGDDPPAGWLVDGLPTVAAVETVSASLAQRIGRPIDHGAWSRLTRREREVAGLAAGGASNGEIADTLFVSRRTVESHLQRVYRKLDLHSRAELAKAFRPHVTTVVDPLA